MGSAWLCVKLPLARYVRKGRVPSSRALSQNPEWLFWALKGKRRRRKRGLGQCSLLVTSFFCVPFLLTLLFKQRSGVKT